MKMIVQKVDNLLSGDSLKGYIGVFRIILVSKEKNRYKKPRLSAIYKQVFVIIGQCQSHQN